MSVLWKAPPPKDSGTGIPAPLSPQGSFSPILPVPADTPAKKVPGPFPERWEALLVPKKNLKTPQKVSLKRDFLLDGFPRLHFPHSIHPSPILPGRWRPKTVRFPPLEQLCTQPLTATKPSPEKLQYFLSSSFVPPQAPKNRTTCQILAGCSLCQSAFSNTLYHKSYSLTSSRYKRMYSFADLPQLLSQRMARSTKIFQPSRL